MARIIEEHLQELEGREAIRQAVCGYGFVVGGCNAKPACCFYVDDDVYAVGDIGAYDGRENIEAIARSRPATQWCRCMASTGSSSAD